MKEYVLYEVDTLSEVPVPSYVTPLPGSYKTLEKAKEAAQKTRERLYLIAEKDLDTKVIKPVELFST